MPPVIFPSSFRGLETLSECDGMCICVNSFVNTDERDLIAGWALKQTHIVPDGKGGRAQARKASFMLPACGDFRGCPAHEARPLAASASITVWSSAHRVAQWHLREGDCWTSTMPGFRWPNVKGSSQIHFSFSTWSQILETENSRPGTIRGKLGVFSRCPPLSFEDSTSWPIPGKSLKPYVSEEDFLEGSSQQMTVLRL